MQHILRREQISKHLALRWSTLLSNKELAAQIPDTYKLLTESFLSYTYNAKWRHYHTYLHLERMFEEFDKQRGKLKHPECVEFAIFLHDMIHVPGAKNNHIKNARVARAWLRAMSADALTVRRVARLITVATKHPQSPKQRLTSDEKYMSDFILYDFSLSYDAVLGQSRDMRREFVNFTDEEFKSIHSDYIMTMMRDHTYHTKYYSHYDVYTKENMRRLLQNMDQVVCARPTDKRS